jgi:hypothetical protein
MFEFVLPVKRLRLDISAALQFKATALQGTMQWWVAVGRK